MLQKTQASPDEQRLWLLFGGIWLIVGVIFLAVGAGTGYREYRFRKAMTSNSGEAQGTVLSKLYDSESAPPGHYVDYRFHTADGRKFYGSARVSPRAWDRNHELQTVAVYYSLSDPSRNWIDGVERSYLLSLTFGGLGALLIIAAAVVVRWRITGASR